jgi:protein-disulfide isomerase
LATKKEQREQARAEREQREAAEAAKAQRKKRLLRVGGVLVAAVVIVVIAVVVSSGGSKTGGSSKGSASGASQASQLLNGIPQSGITLGNPKAPVTLIEFADLQCPFCKQYTADTFPTVVAKYVRSGKVKMQFRNYAFIGPDSVTAARAAEAAGLQNKLWQFIDVFYANQGTENTDYVTDKFLQKIGKGVDGLNVQKLLTDRANPKVDQAISLAQQEAQTAGVNSTPSFLLQKGSAPAKKVSASPFEPAKFTAEIDAALAGSGG